MKNAYTYEIELREVISMCADNSHYDAKEEIINLITEIQQDAFCAGMERAAAMVQSQPILSDFSLSHPNGADMMARKIKNEIDEQFKLIT